MDNELTIGKTEWDHARRGKQSVEVLLRGTDTVVIRHDDQKSGPKRTYMPAANADELRQILDGVAKAVGFAKQQRVIHKAMQELLQPSLEDTVEADD